MASHVDHPPIATFGLADDCERCTEHAQHPWRDLDPSNLRPLIEMAVDRNTRPRSETEAIAVANVLTQLERFGKLAEAAPELTVAYLARWGVRAELLR